MRKALQNLLIQMLIVILFFSICTVTGFVLSYLIEWNISLGERITLHYLGLCCANGVAIIASIFIVGIMFAYDETK